jgi:hypothetical protein
MDQTKKPFEVPTLTTYGTLAEITEAYSDKSHGHGHAWAWGHYKDHDLYKDDDLRYSILAAS